MSRFDGKGDHVKESALICLTPDMNRTARWFGEALGWYGNIVERDSQGMGPYEHADKGREKISPVQTRPWGGRLCRMPWLTGI